LPVPEVGTARTGQNLKAARLAVQNINDRPVMGGIIGPYSFAGRLFDMTEMMTGILMDPETEKYPNMVVIMNHGKKQVDNELVFVEDKAWPTDVLTRERYYSDKPYNPVWTIKGEEIYFPAETCLPIGNEWFWEDDDEVKAMDDLVKIVESNLENKVNLLLNAPPDKTGKIPEKWIKPLMELKGKMKNKL